MHQAYLSDTLHLLRYEVSQPQAMSSGAPTVRALTEAEHVRVLQRVQAVHGRAVRGEQRAGAGAGRAQ